MNYRERMKEYLKEPNEYSSQYGKWAMLNREQRYLIKRLLREMDSADEVIKHQYFEIERLNNIINKAKEKSIFLQKRYGYVLDDLTYLLMQGSDKE